MAVKQVQIRTEFITLDAFLKWINIAGTGGHAKALIASGLIQVNGEKELRRGRKLRPNDHVLITGEGEWQIAAEEG
ncbi:MAG TPA: RNA-binding S4 domain-containing protein [Symbiobacteriaceae bacterium]|nr:RNA-binding S4 domain-containing protein [Symbiobacteriaceae bacterium]